MEAHKDLHTTIRLQKERIETVKDFYRQGLLFEKAMKENIGNAQSIIEQAQFRLAILSKDSKKDS